MSIGNSGRSLPPPSSGSQRHDVHAVIRQDQNVTYLSTNPFPSSERAKAKPSLGASPSAEVALTQIDTNSSLQSPLLCPIPHSFVVPLVGGHQQARIWCGPYRGRDPPRPTPSLGRRSARGFALARNPTPAESEHHNAPKGIRRDRLSLTSIGTPLVETDTFLSPHISGTAAWAGRQVNNLPRKSDLVDFAAKVFIGWWCTGQRHKVTWSGPPRDRLAWSWAC